MPRYYLKDPQNTLDILVQKGQLSDEPLYKSLSGNNYYILKWGPNFSRVLAAFDPKSGQEGPEAWLVPNNWTGEPKAFSIDEDLWRTLPSMTDDINAEQALDQILRDLLEGDTLYLRRNGHRVAKVGYVRQGDQWLLNESALT